ncbi:ABC transporter permease [Defluviimonas sp. D31]|uniref:ABC transporter permease n=1 Tax=Defluviimonas sp. D31 TaxID=3083253 RepID=UPI00296FBBF8|nr:ABC transporter permease [Defluviimonas sp. D31]MDW4550153.1 ABC transporter permease [Defluviimonas sp. D31]
MTPSALDATDTASARRELRRRKLTAFLFVAPLLLFLVFAFVAPIATMLVCSVYHPVVSELIPETLEALKDWDGEALPPAETRAVFAADLKRLAGERLSGKLAEEINRALPGSSSTIKSSARKLGRMDDAELASAGGAILASANAAWEDPKIWKAIRDSGAAYTPDYYLTALDLEMAEDGGVQPRDGAKIYVDLYTKTLRIALYITVLTLIGGYPLAYYLANAESKNANMLMVFVLLPFWTSLLVRTTSWIALLQTSGVVNSVLMGTGITRSPLEMLYTQFSTVLAMTHILMPFMILPLYSVMKGIDPSYMRAAMSMGSKPIPAFLKIYLPMTLPGLSAGVLLVFIISVGYYITPALVGGTDGQMISNIIAFHMQQSNNWELAAALGSLLLAMILVLYWVYDRFVGAGNIKLG